MSAPEEALERARRAATERAGEYAGDPALDAPLDAAAGPEGLTAELLRERALIEVDADSLYSTRRGGAAITFLKRGLLRLLRQYTADLEARQTRFNFAVLARLHELERRVERGERR